MTMTCWWCNGNLAPKPRHEGFFSYPLTLPTGDTVKVHKVCLPDARRSFVQETALPEREGYTGLTKSKSAAE